MENRIYLDHAATSPIHPEVIQTMLAQLQIRTAILPVSITLDERQEKLWMKLVIQLQIVSML